MKQISRITFVALLVLFSVNSFSQSTWVAPKDADNLMNPLEKEQNTIKQGKKLYQQFCTICHGDKGKGDGIASAALNPKPANFISEKFQKQSDGAIFWKLTEGKSPMASYKESLSTTQRWQVVKYLKSLKK